MTINHSYFVNMKKTAFSVKKWLVRAFVVLGGALGLVACHSSKTAETDPSTRPTQPVQPSTEPNRPPKPQPLVYGPPSVMRRDIVKDTILPVEDVYGPPVIVEPEPKGDVAVEPESN